MQRQSPGFLAYAPGDPPNRFPRRGAGATSDSPQPARESASSSAHGSKPSAAKPRAPSSPQLAGGQRGGAGLAGVPDRALQPAASVAESGAGAGGRADLRAAPADRLEPAPARRRARDRTVALDGASGAAQGGLLALAQARAARDRPLRVAVPGPAVAHGRQEIRQVHRAWPRAHRGPHETLAAGRLGVRALDRRRLLAAGLQRDPPTRPARTARSSATSRPSSANG
jgi:hypothetical protein